MGVTCYIDGLDKLEESLEAIPALVQAGVKAQGEPVAYALVWEWGSARIQKPGPKTMWSTNPDGEPAILTITAPFGYIRVNYQKYIEILKEELAQVRLGDLPFQKWPEALEQMAGKAAERCASLISETAPIDSGDLRANIVPVYSTDGILEEGTGTELELGMDWAGGGTE